MSRTLVVFAAVSGLAMSAALAQAPSSTSPAPATPAATSSSQQIINAQSRDEWLGSKLKGTAVIGSDDQKIGEIADCEWRSKSIQNMATRKNWHGICVGFSRSLPSNAWWQTKAGWQTLSRPSAAEGGWP